MADDKKQPKVNVNAVEDAEALNEAVEELDPQEQNEALLKYKVTGVVGTYVDPTRDQEWDIAPLFGQAPHPELQNPPPPSTGHGLGEAAPDNTVAAGADGVHNAVDPAQDTTTDDDGVAKNDPSKKSADADDKPDKK